MWGIWHEGHGSGAGGDLGCSVWALWALRELGCGERIQGLEGGLGRGRGRGQAEGAAEGRPEACRR